MILLITWQQTNLAARNATIVNQRDLNSELVVLRWAVVTVIHNRTNAPMNAL